MNKRYIDFICSLHGYMIRVKEFHWSTDNNAEHLLCDEIEDSIHDIEDRLAECLMGMVGSKFKVGDLKPMLPNAKNLKDMLRELEVETNEFKKGIKENQGGVMNICDDLLETVCKYKYRATQR